MLKVEKIEANKILDSRGNPTVEAVLTTNLGIFKGAAPSGASVGEYEAMSINPEQAIKNVNGIIAEALTKKDIAGQEEVDEILIKLDGQKNKSRLGANSILPVSIAYCRALAADRGLTLYRYISLLFNKKNKEETGLSLPRPSFNILNGGKHAHNGLDIQEFMVLPTANSFRENLSIGEKVYAELKKVLEDNFGKAGIIMGDEGGFAPPIEKAEDALKFVMEAIKKSGYEEKIKIGLDCAASEFYKSGGYVLEKRKMGPEELSDFYQKITSKYPIIFLEDPFSENDYPAWQKFLEKAKIYIIGDDLIATNTRRMEMAEKSNLCNGMIIKPNQIGTVTETLEAVGLAREYGWKIIVSHRSGETMDSFIADLAAGIGADFIKSGAPGPKERMAKYNRLTEIERKIKN